MYVYRVKLLLDLQKDHCISLSSLKLKFRILSFSEQNLKRRKSQCEIVNGNIIYPIEGSLNKFPDFFRMDTFIDSTHMKLESPWK